MIAANKARSTRRASLGRRLSRIGRRRTALRRLRRPALPNSSLQDQERRASAALARPRSACWRRKRRHRPRAGPSLCEALLIPGCLRRGRFGLLGWWAIPTPDDPRRSRADLPQGDKVVRLVRRSTLSPWGRPTPRRVGRRRTGCLEVVRSAISTHCFCPEIAHTEQRAGVQPTAGESRSGADLIRASPRTLGRSRSAHRRRHARPSSRQPRSTLA